MLCRKRKLASTSPATNGIKELILILFVNLQFNYFHCLCQSGSVLNQRFKSGATTSSPQKQEIPKDLDLCIKDVKRNFTLFWCVGN